MQTVAIVGVGLIGASFGLALREIGFTGEIIGVSSSAALEEAKAVGAISAIASLEQACQKADVIYLARNVEQIISSLEMVASYARKDALVTDAGSTKVTIAAKAAAYPELCFLGGHPLAGKEKRGAAAAEASLFRSRPYLLTPLQGPASPYLASFRSALTQMGAIVLELTPEKHDRTLAYTSHLPQLVSTALAGALNAQTNPDFQDLFGPGLVDMTRLALSSPDLWSAILRENREPVLEALDSFVRQIAIVREAIVQESPDQVFQAAQNFALTLRHHKR